MNFPSDTVQQYNASTHPISQKAAVGWVFLAELEAFEITSLADDFFSSQLSSASARPIYQQVGVGRVFFWRILDAYEMTSLADMFISIFLCNYIVPVPTLHPQKVRVGLVILYFFFFATI